jgi:hypothetical protein
MTSVRKVTSKAAVAGCVATFAAALGPAVTPVTAFADPAGHQVTYTITATGNLTGNVRYMNTDPPNQAAYDANSSQFMNSVQTAFTAGQPLVYTATLANPDQWAIVTASGGCHWPDCGSGDTPQLHCEIAVDGQVVASENATTGVTCSTRRW